MTYIIKVIFDILGNLVGGMLCKYLIDDIYKAGYLLFLLALTVLNVICSMVFGHRYQMDDPEFHDIFEMNRLLIEGSLPGSPSFYLPFTRFLPNERYDKVKKGVALRDVIIGRKVAEHKETYDPNVVRDLTDSLIKSSHDTELLEGAGVKEITNDQLEMVIFDIFFAGAETTYTTLRWSILYLLHYPQFQEVLYKEILDVVGCGRYPELKDRASLHFVQATIQETLRMSSIVRLNLPHKATQDATIGGKNVPKGTMIHFNLWNMHNNDEAWENPSEFNPYRWLDGEKKYVPGKHKSFLPFSAGKRSCLGESLAKTELFLIFSRLVRDFKFEPNPKEGLPSKEGRWSVVYAPLPYTVLVSPRTT